MVNRWWRIPGDVIWQGDTWQATFLYDDGSVWGLHLADAGVVYPRRVEANVWWDASSSDLDGEVHGAMPADDIAALRQSLVARSPHPRDGRSELEQKLLDRVAKTVREHSRISGKRLRLEFEKAASANSVQQALDRLSPRYIFKLDGHDGDQYEPTDLGLLESVECEPASKLLEATLSVLGKVFLADPDVRTFPWTEVASRCDLSDDADRNFAGNVYRVFDWSRRSVHEQKAWHWDVPKDIEELRKISDLPAYYEYCRSHPELRPWPTCPSKLSSDEDHDSQVALRIADALSSANRADDFGDRGLAGEVTRSAALAARLRIVRRDLERLERDAKDSLRAMSAKGGRTPGPLLQLLKNHLNGGARAIIRAHLVSGVLDVGTIVDSIDETLPPVVDSYVAQFFRRDSAWKRAGEEVKTQADALMAGLRDQVIVAVDEHHFPPPDTRPSAEAYNGSSQGRSPVSDSLEFIERLDGGHLRMCGGPTIQFCNARSP